ncbi:sensor histidine kinase [Marinicauda algicola]|nr:HWE histidine kinase domain-containing protein [Marinicauda algicola]
MTQELDAPSPAADPDSDALAGTLDHILAFVATLAPTGEMTAVNQPALDIAGLTRADVIGKPFWECFWWAFDEDVQRRVRADVKRAASGGTVRRDALVRVSGDQMMNVDYQLVARRDGEGRIVELVASGVDITERKAGERRLAASEARLRTIFDSIDQGYCLCEIVTDEGGAPVDYRFLEVNPLFEQMTGLKNAKGRTAFELLPDLERKWLDDYARVGLGGETIRFQQGSQAMGRFFDVFATPVEPHGCFALVFKDITAQKEHETQRALLVRELNHRVKNSLATIQAMANHTLRHAEDLESFSAAFTGRLQAMAAAHDIIFNAGEGRADLHGLIEAQLGPHAPVETSRLDIAGPSVQLPAPVAHGLALVLHELVTNASKYGALSNDTGVIRLSWETGAHDERRALRLTWREEKGPRVEPPRRQGFGTRLISATLEHSLGGKSEIIYDPRGLQAEILLPL